MVMLRVESLTKVIREYLLLAQMAEDLSIVSPDDAAIKLVNFFLFLKNEDLRPYLEFAFYSCSSLASLTGR